MPEPTRSDEQSLLCCYLVYALAPVSLSRREADALFNSYIAQRERGIVVHHDHFIDRPGAFAVFEVRTQEQKRWITNPGPLVGWHIAAHPLLFSPDGAGFFLQADSTMRHFRETSLDQGAADAKGSHSYTLVEGGGFYEG